jgi:polar amino acid transport system substrate-binding protein
MRRILACLTAALFLVSASASADTVLNQAKSRGTLVAAVVPDELPLAAAAPDGGVQGFDVDIATEVAKRLQLPVKLVTPGWDRILSGEWNGQWDYAVASITPTPSRKERIAFAAVYRIDAAVLVVRADDTRIASVAGASGKTIGVKGQTTFEKYLRKDLSLHNGDTAIDFLIENAKIRTFPSNGAALDALVAKQVDAVITTQGIAESAIHSKAAIRIVPRFLYFEQVGIVTAKGAPEFDAAIAKAVHEMRDDGTLAALSIRWFGIDLSTITQ